MYCRLYWVIFNILQKQLVYALELKMQPFIYRLNFLSFSSFYQIWQAGHIKSCFLTGRNSTHCNILLLSSFLQSLVLSISHSSKLCNAPKALLHFLEQIVCLLLGAITWTFYYIHSSTYFCFIVLWYYFLIYYCFFLPPCPVFIPLVFIVITCYCLFLL